MIFPTQFHLPSHAPHTKAFIQAVLFNKPTYGTKKVEGAAWELRAVIRSQWIAP